MCINKWVWGLDIRTYLRYRSTPLKDIKYNWICYKAYILYAQIDIPKQ